ncbi:MAG: lipoate--protein ligase family protein [Thermoplasmata archaeon]|nr:MAG: lipoate--protein ligase family protein [Thermoplasmata archaeon]
MRLYYLGSLPWKQTQLIYHALARCGEESIIICTPKEEYACVGFHQDLTQELDMDYCKNKGIGMFRREIGGGTVFLDKYQLFYQIIIARENAPLDQRVLFQRYLEPVVKTYRALGINAKYNPVSDLVVDGKKISGNGGGDIGNCKVMTGSILLDFKCDVMCKVLRLPSERFRQKVYLAMEDNLTTIKKELGYMPDYKEIKSILISNYEDMFGELERGELDSAVIDIMGELDNKFSSEGWLFKKMKQTHFRTIKIIEGITLSYIIHKGVKMCIETQNEEIRYVEIYNPKSIEYRLKLKELLVNKKFDESLILNSINLVLS